MGNLLLLLSQKRNGDKEIYSFLVVEFDPFTWILVHFNAFGLLITCGYRIKEHER